MRVEGDTEQLPEALTSRVEQSLFVVTASEPGGDPTGCLVGFTTQCSIDPPRFIVCISKVNHTYDAAHRAEGIGLHLLGEDQIDLASLFGEQTGDRIDKFERCRWRRGLTGAPILEDCAAWMEGSVLARYDVGDHEAAVLCPVDGGGGAHERPLTYQRLPSLDPGHPASE